MNKEKLESIEKQANTENHEEKCENQMELGMGLGLAIGSVGMCICAFLEQFIWGGLCVAVGLVIGMTIGSSIPKKK